MLLTEHINYPLEDQLYRDWIDAQRAATSGKRDGAENICFRYYEVARSSNRTLERMALEGKSFAELRQTFVDHCARLSPLMGGTGWSNSSAEMARWWDQGRLILAVANEQGNPLDVETPLPMASQVGS